MDRFGGAAFEVVDADFEAAAAQVDGEVPSKISESNESVTQISSSLSPQRAIDHFQVQRAILDVGVSARHCFVEFHPQAG